MIDEDPTMKVKKVSVENKKLCWKIMNLESSEEILLKKQNYLEVNFYKAREQRKVADDKLIRYQWQIQALKAIGRGFRDKYQKAETQVSSLKAETERLNEKNADWSWLIKKVWRFWNPQ